MLGLMLRFLSLLHIKVIAFSRMTSFMAFFWSQTSFMDVFWCVTLFLGFCCSVTPFKGVFWNVTSFMGLFLSVTSFCGFFWCVTSFVAFFWSVTSFMNIPFKIGVKLCELLLLVLKYDRFFKVKHVFFKYCKTAKKRKFSKIKRNYSFFFSPLVLSLVNGEQLQK